MCLLHRADDELHAVLRSVQPTQHYEEVDLVLSGGGLVGAANQSGTLPCMGNIQSPCFTPCFTPRLPRGMRRLEWAYPDASRLTWVNGLVTQPRCSQHSLFTGTPAT